VNLADRTFSLRIVAMRQYADDFTTSSQGRVASALGVTLSLVLGLSIVLATAGWLWHEQQRDRQANLAIEATRAAHNAIVGYVCHELRNPLHVLETWFKILLSEHPAMSRGEAPSLESSRLGKFHTLTDDGCTSDDIALICVDVKSALSQMRTTCDDVLDLRRVCGFYRVCGFCSLCVSLYVCPEELRVAPVCVCPCTYVLPCVLLARVRVCCVFTSFVRT
jgi:hypothetical protein